MKKSHSLPTERSPAKASFFDNLQHLFWSLLSVKTFSTWGRLNALYARISVALFVAKYWRRGAAAVFLVSFLVAAISLVVKGIAPDKTPYGWLTFTASAVFAFIVFISRFLKIHKLRAFGGQHQRLVLNASRLLDKKSQFRSGQALHLSKIVPRSAAALIVEVKHFGDIETANWVEFDADVSKHLLDGHIVCEKTENNKFFHFGTKDILDQCGELRDTQIEVLDILRRDALEKGESFFDGQKLSLGSIKFSNNELSCVLGRTSYFCSMVTNDASAKVITTELGKIHDDKTLGLFPAVGCRRGKPSDTTYKLNTIGKTVGLSNHIGSVVVAVSSDGVPVLCFQTKLAKMNAGKSVLSGSGSLEYEDFFHSHANKTGHLDDAVRFGMARELLEETGGIPQDSYRRFDQERLRNYAKRVQLAGFYRDLRRGAFPIFIGFCRMEASFAQIKDRSPSAVWGKKSPRETILDKELPHVSVKTVDEYQKYLRDYIKPSKTISRTPSDQVLVIEALLEIDVVAAHFQRVLDSQG